MGNKAFAAFNPWQSQQPCPPPPPTVYSPPKCPPPPPLSQPECFTGCGIDTKPPPCDCSLPNPGTFDDLHKKTKEVFPPVFDGIKVSLSRGLSNHFQLSHTLQMTTVPAHGSYRFGCSYVGGNVNAVNNSENSSTPPEAFPILVGEIDPSGNLSANVLQKFGPIKTKFMTQIRSSQWVTSQLTLEQSGKDYTGAITFGDIDIMNRSGIVVGQYLQSITKNLSLGTEFLYQYGSGIPGKEIGVFSLAGKYTTKDFNLGVSVTPRAGGFCTSFYQKCSPNLSFGVELQANMRSNECGCIFGYQYDSPPGQFTFRGQVDSNCCVAGVMEKKLTPFVSLSLSAIADHVSKVYKVGIGFMYG